MRRPGFFLVASKRTAFSEKKNEQKKRACLVWGATTAPIKRKEHKKEIVKKWERKKAQITVKRVFFCILPFRLVLFTLPGDATRNERREKTWYKYIYANKKKTRARVKTVEENGQAQHNASKPFFFVLTKHTNNQTKREKRETEVGRNNTERDLSIKDCCDINHVNQENGKKRKGESIDNTW